MSKGIIVVGGGGHGGVVIQTLCLLGHAIEGIADDILLAGSVAHGLPVLGDPLSLLYRHEGWFAMGIGSALGRARYLAIPKVFWAAVCHPDATCNSKFVGMGCFIGAGARVGNNSRIGNGVIINTNASLDHDSEIGDFSHLGPGAVTGGHVKIGAHTMIGIGAMIRDHLTIGSNCVIGMGSVVLESVPDNCTVWGNPARIVRRMGSV